MGWEPEIEELSLRRRRSLALGGPERVSRHHAAGRLTVRERVEQLVDPGSFLEIGGLAGSTSRGADPPEFFPAPYVAGLARIDGRRVVVGGEDFTVRGGSEGRAGMAKANLAERMAKEYRVPLVLLQDAAGGSVAGIESAGYTAPPTGSGWGELAVELLGLVPVAVGVMGSVAGGPAGRAMLSHWSCMIKNTSEVFVAGPPVVKRAIGLDIAKHDLGGSQLHAHVSGAVDDEAEDELDFFVRVRRFLSFLPNNVYELPPHRHSDDPWSRREEELLSIVPRERKRSYDMRRLIGLVFDQGSFFELKQNHAKSLICGFARLNGTAVGIVANNPNHLGGAMDAAAAAKCTHFVEFCDYFSLPIVDLIDVPGLMVGPSAEMSGTIREAMRLFWVARQVTVPRISIIVRKCYGIGAAVTGAGHDRLTLRLAWPSGEWGALPIEGGVDAAFRREIEAAPDPAVRRRELEQLLGRLRSPFATAEALGVEDIIDPRDTRPLLAQFLEGAVAGMEPGPKPKFGVRP